MAKHATHKATPEGRARTNVRKSRRAEKYRTTKLDVDRLKRELSQG